jgi:tetratricopeptide (TPR) repeat protein
MGSLKHALRFVLLLGVLVPGGPVSTVQAATAASTPAEFRQGLDAYAGGAYDQAAITFRELAQRQPSAGAYHNLGNAEWKQGQPGEAVLAWEKAQWLDPFDANTRVNLRFARQKVQLPSPALAWYEICSTWLPVRAWALLASASLWLALALVLLPGILRWRKADWHHALAAASLAVFLLTMPALLGVQTRAKLGVIRAKETLLRLTPTREAQALGKLPAGEMARLERERGQYVYVRTGNDVAGWVERAQFGQITEP